MTTLDTVLQGLRWRLAVAEGDLEQKEYRHKALKRDRHQLGTTIERNVLVNVAFLEVDHEQRRIRDLRGIIRDIEQVKKEQG